MKENNKINISESVIIFFLIGIIPFVVYGVKYNMPGMTTDGSLYEMFDYFNYMKVLLIKCTALVIFVDFILSILTSNDFGKYKREKISLKTIDKKYIFCALIVISTIIAFLVSDYKGIALFGAFERFDGLLTQFSYIIIFIYALKALKKVGAFEVVTYATLLSTFIVGGIGTLQFLNVDVFNSSIMKALSYRNFDIKINLPGSFTTMYNTNTSGLYAVLMLFLLCMIFMITKKTYIKCVAALDFVLIGITFFNSYSQASYIALVAGLIMLLILYLILMFRDRNFKKFGIILGVSCVCIIGLGVFTLTNQTTLRLIEQFIGPEATFTDWEQQGNSFYFYNKDDDYLSVELSDDSYNVYEADNLIFTQDYSSTVNQLTVLNTQNFGNDLQIGIVRSDLDNEKYIDFNDYFYIRYLDEPAIVDMNTLQEVAHYEFVGFEGYPNLFTNRGYIWSYSIPIVFEHPLGVGSDVFFKVFPNDNVVGEAFGSQPTVVVDKPHNLYLDMAINNGIIYLVGFIGVVILSLKDKFKLLISSKRINKIAIMLYIAGAFAFLINVLATDSLVVITMIFWIYLAFSDKFFIEEDCEDISITNKK